ncbi:DUF1294 domain-containing protein [Phenylobacterium sp.]|jgi:uncharacterized membrane protein YsdA (DUF1294 family)|uniref:DUF1294 domain-containing protein n=1 Tax=Phenylobacterium sp. TaxID=1871053 RepID=UPI00378390F4
MPLLLAYLLAINAVTYAAFAADKRAAVRRDRRWPERALLALAAAGGAAGGLLAMRRHRHKTRKAAFRLGVPLILAAQAAAAVGVWASSG